ncbi:MAG: hypothetical protein WC455_04830 [Dehalococcoidia bacterium]|jgi:hypothetical protein
MNEETGKQKIDPQQIPLIDKRGISLYLKGVEVIGYAMKSLTDFFENGKLGGDPKHSSAANKKLSQQEGTALTKETASYICFEIVKQVWQDNIGEMCQDDADRVLQIVTGYIRFSYGVGDLQEKLDEYGDGTNQFEKVGRNIRKIVRGEIEDANEEKELAVLFTGITVYMLHEGLKHMFELSESQMVGIIDDFFTNYYPKFIKRAQPEG